MDYATRYVSKFVLVHLCINQHTTLAMLSFNDFKKSKDMISRAHSFPRQILPNSAAPFAKFRGSPRQILRIPRLTAAAHVNRLNHCGDMVVFRL